MAFVVLFPASTEIPDEIADNSLERLMTGWTARHAIVYREGSFERDAERIKLLESLDFEIGDEGDADWIRAFPEGVSCGVCVDSKSGFDTLRPVDCSEVRLHVIDDEPDECNFG